ncbi:protein irg-1-like [Brevipalpus obovatus]|uniref:protein irg-1-like n=1 Tax=Brevipalpus obovatus TaxID=246614 RepID=UPI003D9F73B0
MDYFGRASIIFSDDPCDVNSYLSNNHHCEFYEDCNRFISIVHYMAFHKAKLASDDKMAELILKTDCLDSVNRFSECIIKHDEIKLQRLRYSVLWNGLLLKFTQNARLKYRLALTGRTRLIYANEEDSFYGNGTSSDLKIENQRCWRGCNILGYVLMDVREAIIDNLTKEKTWLSIISELAASCKSCKFEDILACNRK